MVEALIAGVGMRRGCEAAEIVALVGRASAAVGRAVTALAVPAFRRGEPGVTEAAEALRIELLLIEDQALQAMQAACVTRSAVAERTVGFASVAEASALAGAGAGARLVLPRIQSRSATCALAAGS